MKNLIYLLLLSMAITSCKKEQARQVNQYTIEQFYANTRFEGGTFSADETRLLVGSDETGIFNLYEITIADGAKKQLTTSTVESYYPIVFVPGMPAPIYRAD